MKFFENVPKFSGLRCSCQQRQTRCQFAHLFYRPVAGVFTSKKSPTITVLQNFVISSTVPIFASPYQNIECWLGGMLHKDFIVLTSFISSPSLSARFASSKFTGLLLQLIALTSSEHKRFAQEPLFEFHNGYCLLGKNDGLPSISCSSISPWFYAADSPSFIAK